MDVPLKNPITIPTSHREIKAGPLAWLFRLLAAIRAFFGPLPEVALLGEPRKDGPQPYSLLAWRRGRDEDEPSFVLLGLFETFDPSKIDAAIVELWEAHKSPETLLTLSPPWGGAVRLNRHARRAAAARVRRAARRAARALLSEKRELVRYYTREADLARSIEVRSVLH